MIRGYRNAKNLLPVDRTRKIEIAVIPFSTNAGFFVLFRGSKSPQKKSCEVFKKEIISLSRRPMMRPSFKITCIEHTGKNL
jgi:hypothetical protein